MERVRKAHLECIVASLLAVNAFRLEKAQALLPALDRNGLLSPAGVQQMRLAEVIARLVDSGYDRGKLTWLFAERLKDLMDAILAGRLDGLAEALLRGDDARGTQLLDDVRGIGAHVASTAWVLMKMLGSEER